MVSIETTVNESCSDLMECPTICIPSTEEQILKEKKMYITGFYMTAEAYKALLCLKVNSLHCICDSLLLAPAGVPVTIIPVYSPVEELSFNSEMLLVVRAKRIIYCYQAWRHRKAVGWKRFYPEREPSVKASLVG